MASADTFSLEILTPGRNVLSTEVSEVIVPSYNGERGIRANHENFVGLLGTGPLKLVREGNDYWYLISSGVYEIREGKLSILAGYAAGDKEVDFDDAQSKIPELEKELSSLSMYDRKYEALKTRYEKAKGALEVNRRTKLLN